MACNRDKPPYNARHDDSPNLKSTINKHHHNSYHMDSELYRNLPNGCYELKEVHIPDVCDLLVEAFILNNKIWSSANLERGPLRSFFLKVLREHLQSQAAVRREMQAHVVLNFIYVVNGKLVSCLLHYEIDEYRRYQRTAKPSEIALFRELEREGQELIKSVDVDSLQKGKHIYCTWAAHYTSPEYNQQHKIEQVADIYDKIRSQGFEGMICRSSNLKVIQILYPLGGELLKETEFIRGEKKFSLYFAMLHLQNDLLGEFIDNVRRMKEETLPRL